MKLLEFMQENRRIIITNKPAMVHSKLRPQSC